MAGRWRWIALLAAIVGLGCTQVLDLDKYSARPPRSPDGGADAGPIPVCAVDTQGSCTCATGDSCDHGCAEANCTFVCAPGATCSDSCAGGGCKFTCAATATCLFSCAGGGCSFSCDPASACMHSCTGDNCK